MTRTFQSRFLIPPTPEVREIILGILGRAQSRYHMTIYAFTFMSDHYHMQLRAENARQLSRFMCYVNSNIAREVGKITGWKGAFWEKRYTSIIISDEGWIQVARLKYILSNGCKEGLVASPRDWMGAGVAAALVQGTWTLHGKWWDRTKQYRTRVNGKSEVFQSTETVRLSPLPCWEHLSLREIQQRVVDLVTEIELETVRRHRENRTSPMGMDRVACQDPHSAPRQSKSSPAPLFFTATLEARQSLHEAYRAFVNGYRQAAERLRAGVLTVYFPEGSFPPPLPFVDALTPG